MEYSIKAILFDIGGTLVEKQNHGFRDMSVIADMTRFLGNPCTAQELVEKITIGENRYKTWRKQTFIELSPRERWVRFILPEFPVDFIEQHANQLQNWWSESRGKRWVTTKTIQTLQELSVRGYLLGTVSHTSPKYLKEAGIADLFQTNQHASTFGRRKPHPSIFLAAARHCGVLAQECAFIGDRPSRDIVGSREAGIRTVILLNHQDTAVDDVPCPMHADLTIQDISELLDIFPKKTAPQPGRRLPVEAAILYDAALSTMAWAKEKATAEVFFSMGRELGFARFELNHQIPPEVLESIDLDRFHIGTLHDPCPAVIPNKQLEKEDRVITSLNEEYRKFGVDTVKYTIEKAYQLGARSVVIHPGRVSGDHAMDNQLRDLYRRGLKGSAEYETLRNSVITDRKDRCQPHMEALLKSLPEIIDFARDTGLSLGFENRFHYYELPVFDEMEIILDTYQQPWVGWQLDVGHLQVHEELGLMSFQQWLDRFGNRIIGVHLHDVIGIVDHRSPGTGEVDFSRITRYLPDHAQRTLEVDSSLTFKEIHSGMAALAEAGCVTRI